MEYSEERYKELLLQTLQSLQDFCAKNDIQYSAAYGTVLGAVRHKGVIPWDDDIDVFMTRKNYDKFISLKGCRDLEHYEIVDIRDDGYYLPYAKFCDAQTTIWEVKEYPFVIGVFIDVFPIDDVSDDELETLNIHNIYKRKFRQYQLSLQRFDSQSLMHLKSWKRMLKSFFYRQFPLRKQLLEMESHFKEIKGDFCMFYKSAETFDRAKLKREWVEDLVSAPFENTSINIPKDYDGFLKRCYGDYMTLPPVERRTSQHFHYFVDLNRRLSIEEIVKIKNGK